MSFKKINLTPAKKLKNYLFLCFVFSIFFFTSSCTKEDFTEEIQDEVTNTPNSITGKHYQGKEAFNFVNEKKLNEIIGSGQYRDEYAFTIDYSEVIQVIEENVGENITIRVNHPNQKPFMFYNLVISTSLNGTTARLLEYTMTPRFFNSYSRGLTTIQEFEGLVLSQLMYTSYPCEDEEDEMLIIAPYGDYNLVNPTTGTTSGINLINTGFLSGSYSGTTFSGTSPASPGSGGENDPSTFPNFTDGLGNFFNSVGSVFSDAYEWTGNTIRTIFRWIRNLFCGSCSPRLSMARGPSDPIIIIDDNAPPATTPTPLESCDWFYTNFALFQVNTLVGYNPNNDLTPEFLSWWDTGASDPVKVSLLNYLNSSPFITQNTWIVFFQLSNYIRNGGDLDFANQLINLAKEEPNQEDLPNLISLTILIENSGNQIFTEQFEASIAQYTDLYSAYPAHDYPLMALTLITYERYRKLRQINPEWSRAKCIFYASKEIIHLSLDVFGLVPVIGEPADFVNGVLYVIEGDDLNATLSFASTVPILGWATATTKFGLKVVNVANDVSTKVKLVWKVLPNGTIYFGSNSYCRATLRKILNLGVGNANQAHHIIPLNLQTNPVIQKAAKSGSAFHMNEALNGIPLSTAVHSGSHSAYDGKILQKLQDFANANPNATPNQCYNEVVDIISDIRTAIQNNPNTPINQLIF